MGKKMQEAYVTIGYSPNETSNIKQEPNYKRVPNKVPNSIPVPKRIPNKI